MTASRRDVPSASGLERVPPSPQWIKLSGSSPYSSFLPDVLDAASADTCCARHLRPFCFALLFSCSEESAPRSGFGPTTKFKRGYAFRKPCEKLCGPPKKHAHKLGSNRPRVFAPKHS